MEQKEKRVDNICGERNEKENHAFVSFDAKSVNESFARMVVMAFMTDMNPTLDELEDVKTAVSEAVTNAIIHGYGADGENAIDEVHGFWGEKQKAGQLEKLKSEDKQVELSCRRKGQTLWVTIVDHGVGIDDIEEAKQPFFTTKPEKERSGMGFVFMETFMDDIEVYSKVGEGTRVTMKKHIGDFLEESGN